MSIFLEDILHSYRCYKCSLMLLGRQHEDREHKLYGEEHFNEKTLSSVRACTQSCLYRQVTWEQSRYHCGRTHCCDHLCDEKKTSSKPGQGSDQAHAERHGRVEKPAANSEERPRIYC